ncbi:hypothetical protein BDK51DRAFT_46562 [Blyttiomyces helicus]|uniref:Uncharacterized protein n=1 Tax=Blyttiomyces helicus TaxID=388810 RepID=A0A4P9WF63_9FUNG|nr:hypothetical protein BDK51DRAFT_46562 [Blyttiomyces helicus]|eukprot:RKO90465.1 hypothetical protein BDK51DRAFT_46562 [Blyttiomyces helicus]
MHFQVISKPHEVFAGDEHPLLEKLKTFWIQYGLVHFAMPKYMENGVGFTNYTDVLNRVGGDALHELLTFLTTHPPPGRHRFISFCFTETAPRRKNRGNLTPPPTPPQTPETQTLMAFSTAEWDSPSGTLQHTWGLSTTKHDLLLDLLARMLAHVHDQHRTLPHTPALRTVWLCTRKTIPDDGPSNKRAPRSYPWDTLITKLGYVPAAEYVRARENLPAVGPDGVWRGPKLRMEMFDKAQLISERVREDFVEMCVDLGSLPGFVTMPGCWRYR